MGLSRPEPGGARLAAVAVLGAVLRQHRPLDEAMEGHAGFKALEGRDRAFAWLLVATTLRRLGRIDDLIARCLESPLPPRLRDVRDVLRLGACQIVFLGTPAHAAVATSVALAAALGGAGKGLVNAVLRRLAREGADLAAAQDPVALDIPDWLWAGWRAAYGDTLARRIAEASLMEAPLDISVVADPEVWAERLEAELLPTGTLRRPAGGNVAELSGFAQGAWWVQDAAAALPARLLGDVDNRVVADLCAAPGGKTAQLCAAGARVIAIDRSEKRLSRLAENLARLKLTATMEAADAAAWVPAEPIDAALVDAPCSATGTIRRHPDVLRLKTPGDIAKLAAAQRRLLAHAATVVRPGGTLVYCVCSLEPAEGPAVVHAVLAEGAPLRLAPIDPAEVGGLAELLTPAGELRTLPCHLAERGGMDAFYAAKLVRV